jgi:hypothetical protein
LEEKQERSGWGGHACLPSAGGDKGRSASFKQGRGATEYKRVTEGIGDAKHPCVPGVSVGTMAKCTLWLLLALWFLAGELWPAAEARTVPYGVKLCGREFIRAVIFTCGSSRWRRRDILTQEAMGEAWEGTGGSVGPRRPLGQRCEEGLGELGSLPCHTQLGTIAQPGSQAQGSGFGKLHCWVVAASQPQGLGIRGCLSTLSRVPAVCPALG